MTAINRPWTNSFPFSAARFSETQLEQVYKLSRNFVASLDLGCPSAKHVKLLGYNLTTNGMSERDKYLAWVKTWKFVYRGLSELIREYKHNRRTVRFPKYSVADQELWLTANKGTNVSMSTHMNGMSHRHLERLQETAMVLLNARYNAKLASAERRRRAGPRQHKGNAPVSKTDNAGSSPAEVAGVAA